MSGRPGLPTIVCCLGYVVSVGLIFSAVYGGDRPPGYISGMAALGAVVLGFHCAALDARGM